MCSVYIKNNIGKQNHIYKYHEQRVNYWSVGTNFTRSFDCALFTLSGKLKHDQPLLSQAINLIQEDFTKMAIQWILLWQHFVPLANI